MTAPERQQGLRGGGQWLRERRLQAGLSQPILAEATGVGLSTIRDFEQGRRELTFGTLVRLAGLGPWLRSIRRLLRQSSAI